MTCVMGWFGTAMSMPGVPEIRTPNMCIRFYYVESEHMIDMIGYCRTADE